MFGGIAKAIFGSSNDRYVRSLGKIVDTINGFEPTISAMTDDELRGQTDTVPRSGSTTGAELDDLLPEAFATVREAAKRTLGQRHYDVQMIGGIVAPPRRDRRDADRRGQDAGRDARRLSERARRARASTSSRSTTISPAATPTGWARSTASSA